MGWRPRIDELPTAAADSRHPRDRAGPWILELESPPLPLFAPPTPLESFIRLEENEWTTEPTEEEK